MSKSGLICHTFAGMEMSRNNVSLVLNTEEKLLALTAEAGNVLSAGEDVKVIRYFQQNESIKSALVLDQNIISFLVHGQKLIYHQNGKLTIQPGEGFFLRQGNYLTTERCPDPIHGYETMIFLLSNDFLQTIYREQLSGQTQDNSPAIGSVCHLHHDTLVSGVIDQCYQYFMDQREKNRIEKVLRLKVQELVYLLVSSPGNDHFAGFLQDHPSRKDWELNGLMETHFREQLSLEQWAFLAGLSLSSFKRKFESVYHTTPARWVRQRRLQEAWHLLGAGSLNVSEVCYEVGFENPAHFIDAFKEQYHITPKQRQVQGHRTPNTMTIS